MYKTGALKTFQDIYSKLTENRWKRYFEAYQLIIIKPSYDIVANTQVQISRVAGVMDASRKRHLTPGSGDARTVMQKMEEDVDKNNIELMNSSERCEMISKSHRSSNGEKEAKKTYDDDGLCLSGIFSQPHDANVEEKSSDVPASAHIEIETVPYKTSEKVSDTLKACGPPCDELQDMVVEDGAAKDKGGPPEITAHVKVSKAVFSALKTMDDVFSTKLAETGCTIKLPKKLKKPVTVFGSTEEEVQLACKLLKSGLYSEKVKRPQITHFVSIRLTDALLQQRFEEFRAQVRDLQPDTELLPDRLFQRPEKLHMSLSMLCLPDEAGRQAALDVLEDCCRQLRSQPPAEFRLRGLGTFGSAGRTRVLFSRPEPADRLQAAAELLHGRLTEAGLTARQQEQQSGITLHATLLNTTFLTRGAAGRRWRKFRGFDHDPIVEQLGEFDFGEARLEAFEISSLTKKADDGYYASIGRGLLFEPVVMRPVETSERPPDGGELRSGVSPESPERPPDGGEARSDEVSPESLGRSPDGGEVRSDDVSSLVCPMDEESVSRLAEAVLVASSPPSENTPSRAGETPADVKYPAQ